MLLLKEEETSVFRSGKGTFVGDVRLITLRVLNTAKQTKLFKYILPIFSSCLACQNLSIIINENINNKLHEEIIFLEISTHV